MQFEQPSLLAELQRMDAASLDELPFGVIGFDAAGHVCRYNAFESRAAGLTAAQVLGRPLFTEVAQCMNNFLVASKFEEAAAAGKPLDETVPFVLTWRMKPTKVQLRMLFAPDAPVRYILLQRA